MFTAIADFPNGPHAGGHCFERGRDSVFRAGAGAGRLGAGPDRATARRHHRRHYRALRAAVYVPLRRYQAACKRDGKPADGFELLCDFNPPPDARPDATDKYGPCWELASYLLELRHKNVKTRAYVHGEISRHAVLPVIACGDIVMSSDARLGKVVEPGGTLLASEKAAYEEMNGGRFPPALIRKMYDRDLVVVKLFLPDKNGNRYVDEREAEQEKLKNAPVDRLGVGDMALLRFRPGERVWPLPARRTAEHPRRRFGRVPSAAFQRRSVARPHHCFPGHGSRRNQRPAEGRRGTPARPGARR